jgi:hypothetical protein
MAEVAGKLQAGVPSIAAKAEVTTQEKRRRAPAEDSNGAQQVIQQAVAQEQCCRGGIERSAPIDDSYVGHVHGALVQVAESLPVRQVWILPNQSHVE